MSIAKRMLGKSMASTTTQCPFIVPPEQIIKDSNIPQEFPCDDGTTYIFFLHCPPIIGDPETKHNHPYNVQFCKLIGRKRDVFECLNESEWCNCSAFTNHTTQKRR